MLASTKERRDSGREERDWLGYNVAALQKICFTTVKTVFFIYSYLSLYKGYYYYLSYNVPLLLFTTGDKKHQCANAVPTSTWKMVSLMF